MFIDQLRLASGPSIHSEYPLCHQPAPIGCAQQALDADPDFVFKPRSSYDWRDVHLMPAESHNGLADFEAAYEQVQTLNLQLILYPWDEHYAEILLP